MKCVRLFFRDSCNKSDVEYLRRYAKELYKMVISATIK